MIQFIKNFRRQFGAKITLALKEEYAKSRHWDGEKFENLEETDMDFSLAAMPGFIKKQFTDRALRSPKEPLPVLDFDKNAFEASDKTPKFVWFGHAVLLLQINGKNLLIDPMFGENAAPIAPFAVKRFSENTLDIIDKLPKIDAILMTHDHYDHLDYDSILKLKSKVDTYFTSLGTGRHLEKWGVPSSQITELDWWDAITFEGIDITCTPSRHFAGRGATDRAKSFWCGWSFKTPNHSILWSGDGGYGEHFKEIGKKLGPFDWAFLECGQYNELWHLIHMYPEEAIQAGFDVGAKVGIPFHWGGFPLALHPWKEPIERFTAEAEAKEFPFFVPQVGELIRMGEAPSDNEWYKGLE
jgi:L-ascorbate metabolism protein UlaG (beta-lactamase superfamily)